MTTATSEQFSAADRLVLSLEAPPLDSLYRAVIGFLIMPAYLVVVGESADAWKLCLFFLALLVALRIGPGLIRRVIPFSRAVKAVWAERRTWGKIYDSYQWRKLFGLGLGWLIQLFLSDKTQGLPLLMASACLISGAIGLVCWTRRIKVLAAQTAPPAPASA